MQKPLLPNNFRKLPISKRKQFLCEHFLLSDEELNLIASHIDLSELSDVMIESAIGTFPIPLGLATGFTIDGKEYVIPMATEEPSVIAAASHAARLVKAGGGFETWSSEPIMTAQIYLKNPSIDAKASIYNAENKIRRAVDNLAPNMLKRGGGYHGIDIEENDNDHFFCISIHLNVCDAMGANIANTVAEGLKSLIQELTGGEVLMAILTNASEKRIAGAKFQVPEKFFKKGPLSGKDACKRIVEATELANAFPSRAVTHNKGVMNGISALTLATGNDTRAIEAAAHYHAQKRGKYSSLSSFKYEEGHLMGSLEIPLPLGTVGGSISIWPTSQLSLKLLGNPSAKRLCQIAVSLGLAQNLAAIFALVSEGIQSGHMKLHAARIAYSAGARGNEIRLLAFELSKKRTISLEAAKKILEEIKEK